MCLSNERVRERKKERECVCELYWRAVVLVGDCLSSFVQCTMSRGPPLKLMYGCSKAFGDEKKISCE